MKFFYIDTLLIFM